jgi:PAS domain-containing protein
MAIRKRDAVNIKNDPANKKRATPASSARRRSETKLNNGRAILKNKVPAKTAKKPVRTVKRPADNSPAPHQTVPGKFQKILDDISNHKITDKQNAYLATFPELNHEPILELDKEGVVCYLNPSGKSLFPELPALGTRHPFLSDYAEVQKELRRGRKKHSVTNEKQIGSDYYERTFLPVGENHVRIYARDITKRKIAEQTLQTAEQALHNEVENSPLGISIVRINAEKIYANPALLNIFGFADMQEFLDTPVRSFYSPESWKESDVVEAMASHRPYRPALGIDKALEEIARGKGTLYDPEVVEACLKLFNEKGFKFE